MRIVFAGTPDFAAVALTALIAAGHDVVLVLTQPDRPSGRGLRVDAGPVKSIAQQHGIAIAQPQGLRIGGRFDDDARAAHASLRSTPHEVIVVAAYGLILPQTVLDIPPLGCMNIHASLLPRWRGAAPVQRAIEAGDAETGVTIMQMDAGLDTGPVLFTSRSTIASSDTGGSLTARLAALGGVAIVEALPLRAAGALVATSQAMLGGEAAATYAHKISKSEAALDFTRTSRTIVDRVRAFDPWPGCTAALIDGTERGAHEAIRLKVWKAHALSPAVVAANFGAHDAAGTVRLSRASRTAEDALIVRTGDGAVALTELQRPGGKRLSTAHFVHEVAASRDPRFVVSSA